MALSRSFHRLKLLSSSSCFTSEALTSSQRPRGRFAPEKARSVASGSGQSARAGAHSILKFWLGDNYSSAPMTDTCSEKQSIWYSGSAEIDQECKDRFSSLLREAAAEKLEWGAGYDGLAAVILMDQLSRNVYRHSAQMYDLDEKALNLAKSIHEGGSTSKFPPMHRVWLYLTHMHSESLEDQELGIKRFEDLLEEAKGIPGSEALQTCLQGNVSYGEAHRQVIEQWGRFPHRNKILGRQDTPEEEKAFESGGIPGF